MLILGLLGGIASGKSLVADQLKSLGAQILDGDRAGHEVLQQTAVKQAIQERWGTAVFELDPTRAPSGREENTEFTLTNYRINRSALARIVFEPTSAGRAALSELEQITHPRIKDLLEQQLAAYAEQQVPLVVLDAPVMIKAGWHKLCNVLMFVDAPRQARWERAKRRGWDEAEFDRREAAQESLDFKRSLAEVVIDNSGTLERTQQQVADWWTSQTTSADRQHFSR